MMMAWKPAVMTITPMKMGLLWMPEKKSYSSLMRRAQISLKIWVRV